MMKAAGEGDYSIVITFLEKQKTVCRENKNEANGDLNEVPKVYVKFCGKHIKGQVTLPEGFCDMSLSVRCSTD